MQKSRGVEGDIVGLEISVDLEGYLGYQVI